jgi:alanine racemase
MAVVKANAYGHGLARCGVFLEQCGVDALGCAYLEEALILRAAGVRIPILVYGGLLADQIDAYIDNDIEITASSLDKLNVIEYAASVKRRRARVHIKIDTGMERIGVHHYSAHSVLDRIKTLEWCDVVGIFSHFARSDERDKSFTREQLDRFLSVCEFFPRHGLPTPMRHIANSAAVLEYPAAHLDLVRPGIAMYGVMPSPEIENNYGLEPVMAIKTKVVYFKVVKKGNGVSYGHRWHAPHDTRVVTLPIGYGDGYQRVLSNRSMVLIGGKRYPVIGAICMDQMMVNIGDGEAYNGDEVVILGQQGEERITVQELAESAGTVSYEIMAAMNNRIPRRYFEP